MPIHRSRRRPRRSIVSSLSNTGQINKIDSLVTLWIYRILVPLNAYPEFVDVHGFSDERIAMALGYLNTLDGNDEYEDSDENNHSSLKKTIASIKQDYRKTESAIKGIKPNAILRENLQQLAQLIGLSEVDLAILEFAIYLRCDAVLGEIADLMGELSTRNVCGALSVILNLDEIEVKNSLASGGLLADSGLLRVKRGHTEYLKYKLDLISDSFADVLLNHRTEPVDMLKDSISPSSQGELQIEDFQHLTNELKILLPYLKHAMEKQRKGVNIFIYGVPGTGKSEFVKAIAQYFCKELYEVSNQNQAGEPITGYSRLRAYKASQCFFANKQTMLLFDEVEDVFDDGDGFFSKPSVATESKAWINRTLETNIVPTFWLSNSRNMDKAFIRRFDFVIEMPMPSRAQRKQILHEACDGLLSDEALRRFSESDVLAPAVVSRAGAVISCIKEELGEKDVEQAFELIVNNNLRTQGHQKIPKANASALPSFYNPAYINCKRNLKQIAEQLELSPSARICMFGPPGTGKTAYGQWLAEHLGMPLMLKRCSDLLSMWVGGTEKKIAQAFQDAENEGALLLIDEVDSFLQDRRGANRTWEVTQVNEMLTQMESFSGIFIASTNLMGGLDQAALRRFDLNIEFGYLRSEQAWGLLQDYARDMGFACLDDNLKFRLAQLRNITPGDFAAIKRRHRFCPMSAPVEMLEALEEACELKEDKQRAIGFV